MPPTKELATNEQLAGFLFVELFKEYTENVIPSPKFTDQVKLDLRNFADQQAETLFDFASLSEYVSTFIGLLENGFPQLFSLINFSILIPITTASVDIYLGNLKNAVFTRVEGPIDAKEQLEPLTKVISNAITEYKKKKY